MFPLQAYEVCCHDGDIPGNRPIWIGNASETYAYLWPYVKFSGSAATQIVVLCAIIFITIVVSENPAITITKSEKKNYRMTFSKFYNYLRHFGVMCLQYFFFIGS